MEVKKCFFCDKIIVPEHLITTEDITNFFKDNNLEYTLKYTKFRSMIGNKIICYICESDLRIITNYREDSDCEHCRKENEIQEIIERNG